jgi:hypothetical protein
MSQKYRYCKASRNNHEAVEFDIFKNGNYQTTCVVNVRLLLNGIMTHPCGDGNDFKLNKHTALEVLDVIKSARDAMKYSDSAQPKTLAEWKNSGLYLDEFLYVGCEVDMALAMNQLDCVPPHIHRNDYFQVGEAYGDALDERDGIESYKPIYATFHMRQKENRTFWVYVGHCFSGEDVNRVPEKDAAGVMMRELVKSEVS